MLPTWAAEQITFSGGECMERGRKRFPTESLKVAEEEEEEEEQIAREIQSIAARKKNRAGWGMWEL